MSDWSGQADVVSFSCKVAAATVTCSLITSRLADQDKHKQTHTHSTSDLSKVSACERLKAGLFSLPLQFITAMFTRLLSSLTAFVSPLSLPPAFSPSFLLLFFIVAAVVSFLIARRPVPEAKPRSSPPPGRVSIPCLPWLPVLGSLPWLGGGLPPHLLFTQLAHR